MKEENLFKGKYTNCLLCNKRILRGIFNASNHYADECEANPDRGKPVDKKKLTARMLDNVIKEALNQEREQPIRMEIIVGNGWPKSTHKLIGDDKFYQLLHGTTIMTGVEGCDYIDNFIKEYENEE